MMPQLHPHGERYIIETVRDEILSFVKMQIANGVSSVNSEMLSFIISQEIGEIIKVGCEE